MNPADNPDFSFPTLAPPSSADGSGLPPPLTLKATVVDASNPDRGVQPAKVRQRGSALNLSAQMRLLLFQHTFSSASGSFSKIVIIVYGI